MSPRSMNWFQAQQVLKHDRGSKKGTSSDKLSFSLAQASAYSSLSNTGLGQDNSLGWEKSENLGRNSSLGWKEEKT